MRPLGRRGSGGRSGDEGTVSLMVVSDGGRETRTFHVRRRTLRLLAIGGGLLAVTLTLMILSWGYLAVRANRARVLEAEAGRMASQDARVAELARELEELEAAYDRIRDMFGARAATEAGDLWLPPSTGRAQSRGPAPAGQAGAPTEWPLAERGFVTRTPLEGEEADHPGIDIAVPAGSYVRAAGSGTVAETGSNAVYGNYVVVDHGDGYRSLYGHASRVFTADGHAVRPGEVIALTGSSGRSTAPHLHFEILKDDVPVDPLTLMAQP